MKIQIENLGPIKNASIELSEFNILMGKNNSGKTYFSYTIYGFLKSWFQNIDRLDVDDQIDDLLNLKDPYIDLKKFVPKAKKNFLKLLPVFSSNINSVFSANGEEFSGFEFNLDSKKYRPIFSGESEYEVSIGDNNNLTFTRRKNESIIYIEYGQTTKIKSLSRSILKRLISEIINREIFSELLPNPKVITSERSGIHLFQNELDINKNVLIDKLISPNKGKFKFDPFDYLRETVDRYSMPIRNGIDQARDAENITKEQSFIYKENKDFIKRLENFAGIGYKYVKGKFLVTYREGRKKFSLPLYLGSSSSRALIDIYVYLKHQAKKGDILIIDEPELNLHPEMQIKLIRLLSEVSNMGIKILITSHSDYILKEVNNLIMLSNEFQGKKTFLKKHKYEPYHSLNKENVSALIAQQNTITSIEIDKYGMLQTSFDDSIERINEVANTLFEKLQ